MAKPITLSQQVRSGGWESMISANGGLPAHSYTPQVTQRLLRGSEPASGAFWVGGLAASCGAGGRFGGCGLFSRPPPPLFFFPFRGGLTAPPSAFSGRAHALARIQCGLPGCCWRLRSAWPCPDPRVGWAMYTLGSAPLPAGLGPGSAGWAAAPGGCVWLWVRGLGLSVSFLSAVPV